MIFQPQYVQPGQMITTRRYTVLTDSGKIALNAHFYTYFVSSPGQVQVGFGGPSVSLKLNVTAHAPTNRVISLQQRGSDVLIHAPGNAHPQLLYIYTVHLESADPSINSPATNGSWTPLNTLTLHNPAEYSGHMQWTYYVSAVGYAVATGTWSK